LKERKNVKREIERHRERENKAGRTRERERDGAQVCRAELPANAKTILPSA
jgi:hypothetical protein